MVEYVPPLFLIDRYYSSIDDINLYNKDETLLLDVEPIDVKEGAYSVYDAVGNKYSLHINRIKRGFFKDLFFPHDEIYIKNEPYSPQHKEDLRKIIIDFFSKGIISKDQLDKSSLEDMIVILEKYIKS
jgi:hypothetical protein